jgi:hypothetical protein
MVLLTKQKIKDSLANMPEEISLDELIDRLIVLEKIEAAQQQIKNGESMSDEELDKEMEKWFE